MSRNLLSTYGIRAYPFGVSNMTMVIERSPKAFMDMDEEDLRQHFPQLDLAPENALDFE